VAVESDVMAPRRRANMLDAWRVLGSAVDDMRDIGVYLVALNLVWFFSSALIVTAPPATAALYVLTRELGYRRRIDRLDFFRDMRRCWWLGWRWALLNGLAGVIYAANIAFYGTLDPPLNILGRGGWTVVFLAWLLAQLYCFPVLLEQEQPSVRRALRNAFVLLLRHPVYTLVMLLVVVAFTIARIALAYFWIFFTVALIFYLCNRSVWYLTQLEQGIEPDLD
jgi:uncharacterized membrane protein YesL